MPSTSGKFGSSNRSFQLSCFLSPRYWNNPDVLKKFSTALQDIVGEPGLQEGEEDGEEIPSMQSYATEGVLVPYESPGAV